MKKIIAAAALFGSFIFGTAAAEPLVSVVHEDISFSESVYPYNDGLLISNFGKSMNPAPTENFGYIIFRKDGVNQMLVEGLNKPTAMLVKNNFLFVCDSDVLKVFDLNNLNAAPKIIKFAAEDKVVNDIAADGDTLYISITNSGKIYSLNIKNPARLGKPKLWLKIPGPNGLTIGGGEMFIASIPPDYKSVTAENVIYRVKNLKNPVAEKFYDVAGLYDGVALSDDLKTLYISDWATAAVTAIDIQSGKTRTIYAEAGIGPADIAQAGGRLFIPDIMNSRVIKILVGDLSVGN